MTICVLGASGLLGSMLVDYLSKKHDVVATLRDMGKATVANVEYRYLDALHINQKELNQVLRDCDIVINAIGVIPQRHPDILLSGGNVNFNLPCALNMIDIPTIQIATDGVFSGQTGYYTEMSEKDATDEYGISKIMGEIKGRNIRYLRGSIIGRGPTDDYSLIGWFLSHAKYATVNGYTNQFWNGLTTLAFAKICEGIINNHNLKSLPWIQHVVPADTVSKYELLQMAAEIMRPDIKVQTFEAKQKINRILSTQYIETNKMLWQQAGYSDIPTIRQMVKEYAEYSRQISS